MNIRRYMLIGLVIFYMMAFTSPSVTAEKQGFIQIQSGGFFSDLFAKKLPLYIKVTPFPLSDIFRATTFGIIEIRNTSNYKLTITVEGYNRYSGGKKWPPQSLLPGEETSFGGIFDPWCWEYNEVCTISAEGHKTYSFTIEQFSVGWQIP